MGYEDFMSDEDWHRIEHDCWIDPEDKEGFESNMFCDNTGFCCGVSCKNYYQCHKD